MAVIQRFPTGDNSVEAWRAGEDTNWRAVSEVVANDDGSFTFANAGEVFSDYFNFASITLPNIPLTILSVTLKFRGKRDAGSGPNGITGALKVGGTNRLANANTMTTSYAGYLGSWITNPNTGKAWTKEDIEGSSSNPIQAFGYRLDALNGDSATRCTQIYMEVHYETNKQTFSYEVK